MISRRLFVASLAVLAAGCSVPRLHFSVPGLPQEAALTWAASSQYTGLASPRGVGGEEQLQRALSALEEDKENLHGPKQGRYSLTLRHVEQAPALDEAAAWLHELDADLVTVSPGRARALGEMGVLLPLEQFSSFDGPAPDRIFFPSVLDQFRTQSALYALPLNAGPLMLYYDPDYFELEQVPLVDGSWDWSDLVDNAVKLTRRREDGSVLRWGLATHRYGIWWALWQNEAAAVEPATLQCQLQEPAAIEALKFFRGLIHTHRVSPAVNRDLWKLIFESAGFPPAMVYEIPPFRPPRGHYHLAEIPRGTVRSVPVYAQMGIAIAARTAKPEAAYTALKGLVHVMQQFVVVPAEREAVARLGELRPDLQPEEVEAIQRSLEAGRGLPRNVPAWHAMDNAVGDLVRGDDVATVVNQACSFVREYQQTGGSDRE